MSKLEIPGFYKFLRRKTRSKIWNKDRMGYRGSRKRYSVWRAEYNQKWEQHDKDIVEKICSSHGLNIKDYFVESEDDRNPWESALLKLKSEVYICVSETKQGVIMKIFDHECTCAACQAARQLAEFLKQLANS